jgi:hypothetical protein
MLEYAEADDATTTRSNRELECNMVAGRLKNCVLFVNLWVCDIPIHHDDPEPAVTVRLSVELGSIHST